MIRSYRDGETRRVLLGQPTRAVPSDILGRARRKLEQLDAAANIDDLRNPPGNRLETLGGDRAGQWSIRINNQWRICVEWRDGDAYNVEIVDYH